MTKNNLQKVIFYCVCALLSIPLFGQVQPQWLDASARAAQYPNSVYLTGFASSNESLEKVKTAAQTALLENLRVVITANTASTIQSVQHNDSYDELNIFSSSADKQSTADIAGMSVESYTDPKTRTNFAFAYVNKYELIGYYKANLSLQFQQAESALKTAEQLESAGEKTKARKQCEETMPLLSKIRNAQDLLTALDGTANSTTLKVAETENLRNTLTQMQARLAQAVYVYISSSEKLFGNSENIIASRVKADLAHKGCSFVEDEKQADFKLKINANVRLSSQNGGLVFCYADVEVDLFDNYKQKSVFANAFSEKGGANSQEKAGRKAMAETAEKIAGQLGKWIE